MMRAYQQWVLTFGLTAVAFLWLAAAVSGQDDGPRPQVAPSGRAMTSVSFDGRVLRSGGWFTLTPSHSGPSRITIDYGQPHARGRTIFGGLVPFGEVWRLGANWATSLTLDFDVRFGDLDVPRGEYTLFLMPHEDAAELVVSRETRQWGTDYDPARDWGRTLIRHRPRAEPAESLSIILVPNRPETVGEVPTGMLRIIWGTSEYFATWRMLWP